MQKTTKLVWIIFIICSMSTTIIVLTRKEFETNFLLPSTHNALEYIELKNNAQYNEKVKFAGLFKNAFNNIGLVMKKRVEHVNQMCKNIKIKSSIPETVISRIVLDKKHSISWCPIFKAASSVWMKRFADLSNVLTDTTIQLMHENLIQLNNIVKQVFSKHKDYNETIKAIKDTKRFIIIRHPFERLLSAYRDKLEHIEGKEYYHKKFGRHIVLKYRQYETIKNRTSPVPTFLEFLQFIVTERYYDEHWAPFYEFCEPCLLNYNYILKFEHLQEEQLYLSKELGLFQYVDTNNELRNINPYGATTTEISKKYFRDIPRAVLYKLYDLYKNDFMLFSYTPDEYYYMSKVDKNNLDTVIQ